MPPGQLSGNGRLHWSKKAKLKAKAKEDAFLATLDAMNRGAMEIVGRAVVDYEFHFRTKHQRDEGNLIERCKATIDGIVAAGLIQDDSHKFLRTGEIRIIAGAVGGEFVRLIFREDSSSERA